MPESPLKSDKSRLSSSIPRENQKKPIGMSREDWKKFKRQTRNEVKRKPGSCMQNRDTLKKHGVNRHDPRVTSTEWKLSHLLNKYGFQFRQQVTLIGYTVDFQLAHGLIIEADGPIHETSAQKKEDAIRDAQLSRHGYTVLRLPNSTIREDPTSTVQLIREKYQLAKADSKGRHLS
jgi:very-short-patch-repair endonuclease